MTLYPSTKSRWWMKKASATRPDPPYWVTERVDNHEPRQRQNRQTLPRRIPPGQSGTRRGRSPAPAGGESRTRRTLAKLGSRRALRPQTRRLRTDGAPRAATLKRRLSSVRRPTLRVRCLAAMQGLRGPVGCAARTGGNRRSSTPAIDQAVVVGGRCMWRITAQAAVRTAHPTGIWLVVFRAEDAARSEEHTSEL